MDPFKRRDTMNAKRKYAGPLVLLSALLVAVLIATSRPQSPRVDAAAGGAGDIAGKVQGAGSPIAGTAVTLYAANEGQPVTLATGKTGDDGSFKLAIAGDKLKGSAGKVFYLVARGGTPKAGKGSNDAIALMALLGTELPKTVVV